MESTLKKRMERLESVLESIKLCTQPIDGHTDPGSITDCWKEVEDYIDAVKSAVRLYVALAWTASNAVSRREIQFNYDRLLVETELYDFKYIAKDYKHTDFKIPVPEVLLLLKKEDEFKSDGQVDDLPF